VGAVALLKREYGKKCRRDKGPLLNEGGKMASSDRRDTIMIRGRCLVNREDQIRVCYTVSTPRGRYRLLPGGNTSERAANLGLDFRPAHREMPCHQKRGSVVSLAGNRGDYGWGPGDDRLLKNLGLRRSVPKEHRGAGDHIVAKKGQGRVSCPPILPRATGQRRIDPLRAIIGILRTGGA
jgi:hypothetical protein